MKTFLLEKMANMYDNLDSVIITNSDGIIEYAAMFDQSYEGIQNDGYTGKSILEVHPDLTEETSSHFRAIRTGKPILDEVQTLTDFNGRTYTLFSSTFPIESNGKIIGAIEGTVFLNEDGQRFRTEEYLAPLAKKHSNRLYTLDDIITCDKKLLEIKELVERVAYGESCVMICGETGTGKELFAQSIHSHSKRIEGKFISQNCAAIPSELLESTLFGTTKGSYTGAVDKKGLFELADNGTIFLDELNSMEYNLQGKILRAIEEQKIRRIGAEKEIPINVRIVSAMSIMPEKAVSTGKLRADLYFRIGVVNISLPSLKDRPDDIPLLTNYFIKEYNEIFGKKITGCSSIVNSILSRYPWPGNVRELRNVIEYAFNVAKGQVILPVDLPQKVVYDNVKSNSTDYEPTWPWALKEGQRLPDIVNQFEKQIIEETYRGCSNKAMLAKKLGISRQALNYKLSKYGIE